MYNTGITNAAEQAADGEVLSCTMHDRKDGNVGEESAIKKKVKINSTFFGEGIRVPDFGCFHGTPTRRDGRRQSRVREESYWSSCL